MSDDTLLNKIEEAAQQPSRVRTDAGEVESHDLTEMIEVHKYKRAANAASLKNRGLRFNKLEPPGTS